MHCVVIWGHFWGIRSAVDMNSATSFSAEGLNNNTTYYFTVVAYNEQGDGSNAKEKSARPTSDVPAAPTLTTPEMDETTVTLNWSAVKSVAGYKVQYGRTSGNYTNMLDVGEDPNQLRACQVEAAPTLDGRLTEGDWGITMLTSKAVSGTVDNEATFDFAIDGNDDRAPSYDPLVDHQFAIGGNDTDLWKQNDQTTGVQYATSDIDDRAWSTLNITPTTAIGGLDMEISDNDDGEQRDRQNVAFGTENNRNSLVDIATVRLFEQPVQTGIRI